MAKQNSFPVVDQHTYVSGQTTRVRLPLSGFICHLECLLTLNVTTAGGGATPVEDPYGSFLASSRIKASGARGYFDVSDGRQWQYFNHFQYKGQLRADALPTGAAVTGNYYASFPIHLGLVPGDLFDTTGVIPAVDTQDLIHEVTWGTAASLGVGYTVNSATLQLTSHEIALDHPAERAAIWGQGIPNPRFEARIVPIGATYSNLGLESNFPVGDTLVRTIVMALDNTGVRSDARISEIGVKFPKRRETPWQRNWIPFTGETMMARGLASVVTGVGLLEGSAVSGRAVGLPLEEAQQGDAVLGFSITTGNGNIHLLHYMMG